MGRRRIYGSVAERQRAYRARVKARNAKPPPRRPKVAQSVSALVAWVREALVVPSGHPREGKRWSLPRWQTDVLRDCLTAHETALVIARKNGKSALAAILVLAHLAGPLRRPGWRGGVLSVNRAKAGELLDQCEQIALASRLDGLTFRRSPKRILSDTGTVDIESADVGAGHAAGYDLALVDELGLLAERHRGLVAGMRSSTSARNGRFVSLTIHGSGPFVPEILDRRGERGLAVHHFAAAPDRAVDDEQGWKEANPGLGTVKSLAYMRRESARVIASPADQSFFVAHDLNRPSDPGAELLCTPDQWKRCECPVGELPPRTGPCYVGIDLGLHASFTSAAMLWPDTGRFETRTACPDVPALAKRARTDGAGSVYEAAHERGDLWTLSGSVTPVAAFLSRLSEDLAGFKVGAVGADRFRHHELVRILGELGLGWIPKWRGTGIRAGSHMDADCRSFQRLITSGSLKTAPNLMMAFAVSECKVVRDSQGHVTHLGGVRTRSRIDAVQAAVIACGLAEGKTQKRKGRHWVV